MDITVRNRDKKAIKEELIRYLQILEGDNWLIFGWHHMNLEKMKWLQEPQKLADCEYFQEVLKSWLREGRIVAPRKSSPEGLVRYEGNDLGALNVESIYFQLWLAKGPMVYLLSYSEHEFINNEYLEEQFGEARFFMVFRNWLEIIPAILNKEN